MISKHLRIFSLINISYITAIQSAVCSTASVSPETWLDKQNLRYQDLLNLNLDLHFHKNPTYSYAQYHLKALLSKTIPFTIVSK